MSLTRPGHSCVEANLLIICACLSTLRHFVHSVAPWMLSSSRGTSKTPKASGPGRSYELRTIGGTTGSKHRQFDRLDEQFGTESRVESDFPRRQSIGSDLSNGDRSDKGIVQTTTTQVTFSQVRA